MNWEFESFSRNDYDSFGELPERPRSFEHMVACAKVLSTGIPFVRADFYDYGDKALFSEMTFYPCSGFMPFDPPNYDLTVGEMLGLTCLNSSSTHRTTQ